MARTATLKKAPARPPAQTFDGSLTEPDDDGIEFPDIPSSALQPDEPYTPEQIESVMKSAKLAEEPAPAEPSGRKRSGPKTAEEARTQIIALEAELAAIPGRIDAAKKLTLEELDSDRLADCFAILEQLKVRQRSLPLQIWQLRKAELRLQIEELRIREQSLAEDLGKSVTALDDAEEAVKNATRKFAEITRQHNTLKGERSGALFKLTDLQAELLRLQREEPVI